MLKVTISPSMNWKLSNVSDNSRCDIKSLILVRRSAIILFFLRDDYQIKPVCYCNIKSGRRVAEKWLCRNSNGKAAKNEANQVERLTFKGKKSIIKSTETG